MKRKNVRRVQLVYSISSFGNSPSKVEIKYIIAGPARVRIRCVTRICERTNCQDQTLDSTDHIVQYIVQYNTALYRTLLVFT